VSLEGFLASSSVTVSKESFVSGAGDVRTQLKKLQSMNADAVFISVQTVTSGEVVLKQMEQLGFHLKVLFVNDNIIKATSLVTAHSELLEGAIGGDYVFEVSDEARGVLAHYKNVYGVDCPQVNICLAEYDAIRMLAEAIKEKGVVAQDVRGYLADSSYQGLTGTISFDGKNDREGAGYSLFGIDKGAVNKL
jgi:ABC-type branched-subunit amino acid transport system substrate-binding protein